jgi:hypothetical protein
MASTISAGTTSGTAIAVAGDTSGVLQLQTNGTTAAVTIDTSQNVGIGTSSPSGKRLYVLGGGAIIDQVSASGATLTLNRSSNPGSVAFQYNGTETGQIQAINGGGLIFYTGSTPTERMRIDSSGNLLVGTTSSAVTTAGILLKPAGNSASVPLVGSTGASSSSGEITMAVYSTTAAQYQFYVAYNGQATGRFTYATFSDARLKTNISSIQNGLATITALNPVTFNFLPAKDQTENSDLKYGFIAQEVQQLLPTLVNEGLDKAEDGTPYLTLQTGDLLPIAIKAIQELKAELDATKAEVQALKGVK